MDPAGNPRRKILTHTVTALVHEVGFHQVEKAALETLVELFQAHLCELGRTTKTFTEAACRVEPNVGDVALALADMGVPVNASELRNYSRRHSRPITANPLGLPPPKVPQILTAGKRKNLPSYIPDYFPPMPDPHAYIRTPTHKQPLTDYAACREKMSQQKRDMERSLSKFYARTLPCFHLFPENKNLFPLIAPKPVTYINPLIPRDQIFEEDESLPPINYIKKDIPKDNLPKLNDEDESGNEGQEVAETATWELIDNPFLRPVKQPVVSKKSAAVSFK